MRKRIIYRLLVMMLLLSPTLAGARANHPATPLAWADPAFEALWTRNDKPIADDAVQRSWTWGPGPGVSKQEDLAPNLNGVLVQYTDKARMELPNPNGDKASQWYVTTGLLVKEMVTAQYYTRKMNPVRLAPAEIVLAGDANDPNAPTYASFTNNLARAEDRSGQQIDRDLHRNGSSSPHPAPMTAIPQPTYGHYIAESGHNIAAPFWSFLNQTGKVYQNGSLVDAPLFDWLYVMGLPISEPFWANAMVDGKLHLVIIQLFERRALTYDQSEPNPLWQVQMANVGTHYYQWRYGQRHPQPLPPAPAPNTAPPNDDTFIRISGDQFTYRGNAVKLKGSNYFNRQNPWALMWRRWDGAQVDADLATVSALGGNTIRISLPYDNYRTEQVVWVGERSKINPVFIQRINETLQIAAKYQLKVDISLFDWYDDAPNANTPDDNQNKMYLDAIVGAFAGDDRVFAWDIHNEADIYFNWQHGRADKVLAWLQRTRAEIRRLDPSHPIGISMSDYRNLYYTPDPAKYPTALDLSDFAALHSYDAGNIEAQIVALKQRTTKPILLQETGWPTGPEVGNYNDPTQRFLYSLAVAAVQKQNTAGFLQWTLYDYKPGTSGANPNDYSDPQLHEDYFGLIRTDNTLKPAAEVFKSYSTIGLPSSTQTSVTLTRAPQGDW